MDINTKKIIQDVQTYKHNKTASVIIYIIGAILITFIGINLIHLPIEYNPDIPWAIIMGPIGILGLIVGIVAIIKRDRLTPNRLDMINPQKDVIVDKRDNIWCVVAKKEIKLKIFTVPATIIKNVATNTAMTIYWDGTTKKLVEHQGSHYTELRQLNLGCYVIKVDKVP